MTSRTVDIEVYATDNSDAREAAQAYARDDMGLAVTEFVAEQEKRDAEGTPYIYGTRRIFIVTVRAQQLAGDAGDPAPLDPLFNTVEPRFLPLPSPEREYRVIVVVESRIRPDISRRTKWEPMISSADADNPYSAFETDSEQVALEVAGAAGQAIEDSAGFISAAAQS